jgi:hypothetical protein
MIQTFVTFGKDMTTPLLLCVCLGFAGADITVTFKVIVVDFSLQSHRYALMLSEVFFKKLSSGA